jgi:uncharacterized protein GlcG (DUF336 family)
VAPGVTPIGGVLPIEAGGIRVSGMTGDSDETVAAADAKVM